MPAAGGAVRKISLPRQAGRALEWELLPSDGRRPAVKVSPRIASGPGVITYRWSPDSTRIAYQADQEADDVFDLFVSPADSAGGARRLSGPMAADGDVLSYRWAPDGARIAYAADQAVNDMWELYVAAQDGSQGNTKVFGPALRGAAISGFDFAVR